MPLNILTQKLYFICDPSACAGRDVCDVVNQAVSAGVDMVQYRDKSGYRDTVKKAAERIKDVISGRVPFLINDYVDIAAEINTDGVHIGQGDMSAKQARQILGKDKMIGVTAFTPDHMVAIDPDIVNYVGTGPVYQTTTDKGKPVLGPEKFGKIAALSPVPVFGIGGITPNNTRAVVNAGAHGVAVMSGISATDDIEKTVKGFKTAIL